MRYTMVLERRQRVGANVCLLRRIWRFTGFKRTKLDLPMRELIVLHYASGSDG